METSSNTKNLTRTRTKKYHKGHGYAVHSIEGGTSAAAPTLGENREATPHWPAHAPTKRRGQRWAAAAQIRHQKHSTPLRMDPHPPERLDKKRAERQAGLFVPAIPWRERLALIQRTEERPLTDD